MKMVLRPKNSGAWLARERWSGSAAEQMLSMINSLPQMLRPLSQDEVIIRGMYLMNDLPMHETGRWVRRFDKAAIEQAIPLVRGKPVMVNHSTDGFDGLPVGRFFHAEPESRADGSSWMAALFFMLNDDQGKRLSNAIDGGIISENSPTLEFDKMYCSVCGAEDLNCDHVPGKMYDGIKCFVVMTDVSDFWEGSLAWAGQQRNTGFYVAAGRDVSDLVDVDERMVQLAKTKGEVELVTPWQDWWCQQVGSPGT